MPPANPGRFTEQEYRILARENLLLAVIVHALGDTWTDTTAGLSYWLRVRMTENQCRMYQLKGISGVVTSARPRAHRATPSALPETANAALPPAAS
jgi:hypothetical protein